MSRRSLRVDGATVAPILDCIFDVVVAAKKIRYKPYPVRLRIDLKNMLTVYLDNCMQQTTRLCMSSEIIVLSRDGSFGMSAATGGLAESRCR
ncbi:unnamed protein product [Cylicocyclus nassatus]|uniref:L-type lectin-like domain-containing protein n=1 Tax=Cylicocyclus nassatus TaxID=53992 RepID=A0AA36M2H7_CYLNA|nr:unnamed protein product [Cylicocyclus nassatus]